MSGLNSSKDKNNNLRRINLGASPEQFLFSKTGNVSVAPTPTAVTAKRSQTPQKRSDETIKMEELLRKE